MIALSPTPKMQFFDDNGLPLAGGLLFSYKAGTTTPLSTFTDSSGSSSNTNPIALDSAGRADIWLDSGLTYKFILKNTYGSTVWSIDNIVSGGGSSGGSGTITATAVVSNIAALKALTVSDSQQYCTVLGYYTDTDEGGGSFLYVPTSSATSDDGMVVKPSSNPLTGRWLRITDNTCINVNWYGAKGDNSTNNSPAFQAANSYASAQLPKWSLYVPSGTYVLATDPAMTMPVKLSPAAIIKVSGFGLSINPIITDNNQHFICQNSAFVNMDKTVTELHPEWFGALGNGSFVSNSPTTDDTVAIQLALNSAPVGAWVVFDSTKKYWSSSLTMKAGVNIRGTKSYENDEPYRSTLIYNATGTAFLSITGTGVMGPTIRDLIIDGNNAASALLYFNTAHQVTVQNSTLRNATTGISMQASCNYYNITGNRFKGLSAYGVFSGGGVCGKVEGNKFLLCTTAISITGGNVVGITGNMIPDISGTGIQINNTAINSPVLVADNMLTGSPTAGIKGIEITGTATNTITIQNNILHQVNDNIGTAIIADPTLPGKIENNTITGLWDTEYAIGANTVWLHNTNDMLIAHAGGIGGFTADKSWTIKSGTDLPTYLADYGALYLRGSSSTGNRQLYVRSEGDATTGWHPAITQNDYLQIKDGPAFNISIGNKAYVQPFDSLNAPLTTLKDEDVPKVVNSYSMIDSMCGRFDSTVVSNRTWLYSDGITVAIHTGFSNDATTAPYVNEAWQEHSLAGNVSFGIDSTTYATITESELTTTTGIVTNPLPVKGVLNAGAINTGWKRLGTNISVQEEGFVYRITDHMVNVRLAATNDYRVYPQYDVFNPMPENTLTSGTIALDGVGEKTFVAPSHLNYYPGQYCLLSSKSKTEWFTGSRTWPVDAYYMWGKITDYKYATGEMTVLVMLSKLFGSASITDFNIISAFPFWVTGQAYKQQLTALYNDTIKVSMFNPSEWVWAASDNNDGIASQTINVLCDIVEDIE